MDALDAFVARKLSESKSLRDTLTSVVAELNSEHATALSYLRLPSLVPPTTLSPRAIPQMLALVGALSSHLVEHAGLRRHMSDCVAFEEEGRTVASLKAVLSVERKPPLALTNLFGGGVPFLLATCLP